MFDKKVLCLGNNDESTDVMVSALAVSTHTVNHGFISEDSFVPLAPGYYHTTVLDMPYGGIINLAAKFDLILFLDQDKNNWSNWKPFLSTYKLMLELEQRGCSVQYKQNQNIKNTESFHEFLANNKSFCIYLRCNGSVSHSQHFQHERYSAWAVAYDQVARPNQNHVELAV